MHAVTCAKYSDPSGYELSEVDEPTVTEASDVVIRVHAVSINPIDVKKAGGAMKAVVKDQFPYKIGYDLAGVVTAVGDSVSTVKEGDEVYVRLPESHRGSWAEFAKAPEGYVALKPKSMSFAEAASLPLAAMTALQALRRYEGSLAGKTVFVPAGLNGTGMFACQLAKNVFGAGKVITTVSTAKVPKVPELLGEGVVDQIIDYKKQTVKEAIPAGSVDFFFDTTAQAMEFLSLMTPKTGLIISISTTPSGATMRDAPVLANGPEKPKIPFLVFHALNAIDTVRKLRAKRWGTGYDYIFLKASAEDLNELRGYVDAGKLKTIVGQTADLKDIGAVKKVAMDSYQGKTGLGKIVIDVRKD